MNVKEMHYDLSLRIDKIDSLHYENILHPERDVYLNRAQITLIKQKYGINNTYLLGFEENQKRIEDLKVLVVKSCDNSALCQNPISATYSDPVNGIYTFNLDDISKGKYMVHIANYIKARKDRCEIDIVPKITQHDDLYNSLVDHNYKPSFEWMYLPIVFSENYIYAYTNNEFTISKMYIDYLRYPVDIRYGNYNDENGNLIPESNCELPDYIHHEILDLAEALIKKDLENPTVELSYKNLQLNE